MPKNRKVGSASSNRVKASPYHNSSKGSKKKVTENLLGTKKDLTEWEEARCPICMEHPHSAILLQCSSHKNGCHPYMCNTGCRHSNCFDEFFKKHPAISSTDESTTIESEEDPYYQSIIQQTEELNLSCGNQSNQKLECPLCRGQITGWVVDQRARRFMNTLSRSCSFETCDFIGTYPELRKHARIEHPSATPWDVDQKRKQDWKKLEHAREVQDVLSVIQADYIDSTSGELTVSPIYEHWLALHLLGRSINTQESVMG